MNPAAQLGDLEDGRMAAQLPEVLFVAAHRDEPEDDDAEALRHYAFLFMLLVASGLIYVVGNPCSSFAAEDVLTLFLFWNIFLVVFLVSFVPRLHPVVARIAALIAHALRTYLFACPGSSLLELLYVAAVLLSSAYTERGLALLLFLCWALSLTLWLVSLEPRRLASAASAEAAALPDYFLGGGGGGDSGGSAARLRGRDLVRIAAIPWPAVVVILASPLLICTVGELGTDNAIVLFVVWILSMGVLFGLPSLMRIARFVAAAALPDYFLGGGSGGGGGGSAARLCGRDLVRIAAIPWPAVVVILASPLLICTVGELGADYAIVLFVVWILSMGVLFGLPTPTRIARFVAAALRN